ncbi:MAG: metallophosphoesterase family protein [Candidatus Binatia bacterium]
MKKALLLTLLCGLAACGEGHGTEPAAVVKPLCATAAITKGPWVTRVDDSHATVFWESRDAGCVQIGIAPEAGGQEIIESGTLIATTVTVGYNSPFAPSTYPPDETGIFYLNEVSLTHLAPGTCYGYRVNAPATATGRLCTMQLPGHPIYFLAIGDTNPALGKTVPLLNEVLTPPPDFVVHTGDIQYYSSFVETWQYWFGAMKPMLRAAAFMPCIGNHENELNGTEFADYYARLFPSPGLIGTPLYYRYSSGGVHFFSLDTEAPFDTSSAQYTWLSHELAAVTAEPGFRFSVVYLHRPLYTLGDSDPEIGLRGLLAPLFQANRVRLVLQGHMHGYERFEVGNITYITTAGGGALIGDVNANVINYPDDVPLRVAAAAKPNALQVTIGQTLKGVSIDQKGTLIDQFEHDVP